MKEKEHLYEESIQLKIQANIHRDENIKLKTKIKILENEIMKKEKAFEDFLTQSSQQNQKQNTSVAVLAPISSGQKFQNETFLVMSLKKQVKEQKQEIQKKDEEIDILKKNIKNTRAHESEIEVQSYRDELTRLRYMLEQVMRKDNQSISYQQTDRVPQLENQIQQSNFIIQKLQSENQEVSNHLAQKSDELAQVEKMLKELSDKHRKELAKEQSKSKKLIKEKEKDIIKLRSELSVLKKPDNNKNENQNKEEQSQLKSIQNQLILTQKKAKDLANELKTRNDKIEEQDGVIKKLQERLQSKIDDFNNETLRLNQQIDLLKKQNDSLQKQNEEQKKTENTIRELSQKCKNELYLLTLIAKKNQISRDELSSKLQNEQNQHFPNQSADLKELIQISNENQLYLSMPKYNLPKESQEKVQQSQIHQNLNPYKTSIKESCSLEDLDDRGVIQFDKLKEVLKDLEIELNQSLLEYIEYTYFEQHENPSYQVFINYRQLMNDVTSYQSEQQNKKLGNTAQEKINKDLDISRKAIDEKEESYEEDFEEKEKEHNNKLDSPLQQNPSKKLNKSLETKQQNSLNAKDQENKGQEEGKLMDEEEMLDIAEHCFIKIAETMIKQNFQVRSVFTKFSIPEQFPDGSILELMSPIGFLEGVKELGIDDLTEMEAACLLRVLTKPELDNAVILNELALIMENFGVVANYEDDDDYDDYEPDEESEINNKEEETDKNKIKQDNNILSENKEQNNQNQEKKEPAKKKKIQLNFDNLEEKGLKILRKTARFLLERYMHPREFFGPAIYKQLVKTKKKENHVEIIQTKDFYQRLKLAGIRKSINEVQNLNIFLCLDSKYPNLLQVKKVVKALEEVAQGEQLKLQEEIEQRMKNEQNSGNNDLQQNMSQSASTISGGPQRNVVADYSYGAQQLGLRIGQDNIMGAMGNTRMGFMNYGQLNTIEEEKHETQTSHYYKDGDTDRDYSQINQSQQFKSSRILNDHNNESNSQSPLNLNENKTKDLIVSQKLQFKQEQVPDEDIDYEEHEDEYIEDEDEDEEDENDKEVSKRLDKELKIKEESKQKTQEIEEEVDEDYEEEEGNDSPRIETECDQNKALKSLKSVQSDINEQKDLENDQKDEMLNMSSDYEF